MELSNEVNQFEKQEIEHVIKSTVPAPLDAETTAYPNQIGGHGASGNKWKILQSRTRHVVYKALQRFPKGVHEVELYERVFDPNCDDEVLLELRNFIPHYQGLFYEPKTNVHYFGMSDLLSHLAHPSICDIKIGRVSYSPNSSPNKVRSEKTKYLWQKDLGFFITAMRIFDGKVINLDRDYGRALSPTSVYDSGIRLFLGPDPERARRLAGLFCARLKQLTDWFEKQRHFAFFASSLLLAYANPNVSSLSGLTTADSWTEPSSTATTSADSGIDSDIHIGRSPGTSDCSSNSHTENESIVAYLIDFTRWCELSNDRDDNVLYGLYKLVDLFERATTDEISPTWSISPDRILVRG